MGHYPGPLPTLCLEETYRQTAGSGDVQFEGAEKGQRRIRAEQIEVEQSRTKKIRMEKSRAKQRREAQSSAEERRAEQSREA